CARETVVAVYFDVW
nr:immunoglobulin heavy chain junction region [Mus musculus]MBK4197906.1 immunoglobulin heavy chain junction region [Mus musculus]